MFKRIKILFWTVCLIISTLLGLWFVASYLDVIFHNLSTGYVLPPWNFFAIAFN